jgi:hypothetical protein
MEQYFLDQLYLLTIGKWADYINPTIYGSVSWWSILSMSEDSEETFENWKQGR